MDKSTRICLNCRHFRNSPRYLESVIQYQALRGYPINRRAQASPLLHKHGIREHTVSG